MTLSAIRRRLKIILSPLYALAGAAAGIGILTLFFVLSSFPGTARLPTTTHRLLAERLLAECAIVFGATVHVRFDAQHHVIGSEPGPGIERRIQTAAQLYNDGLIHRLFLTGGRGEGMQLSEARVMRDRALALGVKGEDMVIEERSTSTKENLQNTRPLTESCTSIVGISDGYHLARIEFLAYQMGWNLPTVPSDWQPDIFFTGQSVVREVLGILFYTVN